MLPSDHADRADRVPAPLQRQPLGEVLERRARRGRVCEPGDPAARREAEEDDQPAAARDHRAGRDLAGQLPGGVDRQPVDGAHPLRVISSAGAVNWPPALLTSTSTRAEALERSRRRAPDLLGLADVARASRGTRRRRARARRATALERLRAAAADRDPGARGGERERRRPADPGAAAGDQRDLAPVRVRRERRAHSPRQTGSRPSAKARGPSSASADAIARS